jgi:hypothetical protein
VFLIRKIFGVLIFCILLACGGGSSSDSSIPDAGPEDYIEVPTSYTADVWYDADKSGNDDMMCWAAAAANMLTATGWEDDEDEIFEYFKDNFANKKGYVYDALDFYFGSDLSLYAVRETQNVYEFISSELHKGKAVVIFIKNPAHYISVWGYRLSDDSDTLRLQITDSNDGIKRIVPMKFEWDGKWVSILRYPGSWIHSAISLYKDL